MFAEPPLDRRDAIAGRLAQGQPVTASALADEFAVSLDAIRRDLRMLAAEGRCRRVYGGALPLSPASTPMQTRAEQGQDRKQRLAEAALVLIRPGDVLFLDSGSTNLALARLLPALDLTVATNASAIAAALATRRDLRLLVIGGTVAPDIGGCVDAAAVLALQHLTVDRCFLGACAVSTSDGLAAFDPADALFKRVLLERSRSVAALVTTDKLATRAPHRVAPLERVDTIVVEHDATAHAEVATMGRLGITVIPAAAPG